MSNNEITNFNIRIYGLIINSKNEILTSIEKYKDQTLHKFVGGGLEKGEGLISGLKREFREELNCEIEIGDLFYINDFFQASYFKKEDQIISIYYFVQPKNWSGFNTVFKNNNINQELRWTDLNILKPESLSLPIDKIVIKKLKLKT